MLGQLRRIMSIIKYKHRRKMELNSFMEWLCITTFDASHTVHTCQVLFDHHITLWSLIRKVQIWPTVLPSDFCCNLSENTVSNGI